jgi:hypothetical protein
MREKPRIVVLASILALLAALVLATLAWLLFGARPAAAAKRPEAEQEKIDELLSGIEGSDATFVRNGTEYDGRKAASHLRSKLFLAGKQVQTARDFISRIATHSEASGEPYEIRPRGEGARPLSDWLLERLRRLEERPSVSTTPAR